jgi:hypothetical protein
MHPARALRATANSALRPARRWLEDLARWGFIANALVYLIVGGLAVRGAIGDSGGRITDPEGALMAIRGASGGRVLLVALVAGFFSYALWRILAALFDGDRDGSSAPGIATRFFDVLKGAGYGVLGVDALRLATGSAHGRSRWVEDVFAGRFGRILMFAIGGGILAFGAYEMYRAYRAQLSEGLRLHDIGSSARKWVVGISRFGIGARALVIAAFAVLMLRAAAAGQSRAPETTASIRTAAHSEPALYFAIGAGLMAYGIYLVVLAKYRKVRTD